MSTEEKAKQALQTLNANVSEGERQQRGQKSRAEAISAALAAATKKADEAEDDDTTAEKAGNLAEKIQESIDQLNMKQVTPITIETTINDLDVDDNNVDSLLKDAKDIQDKSAVYVARAKKELSEMTTQLKRAANAAKKAAPPAAPPAPAVADDPAAEWRQRQIEELQAAYFMPGLKRPKLPIPPLISKLVGTRGQKARRQRGLKQTSRDRFKGPRGGRYRRSASGRFYSVPRRGSGSRRRSRSRSR